MRGRVFLALIGFAATTAACAAIAGSRADGRSGLEVRSQSEGAHGHGGGDDTTGGQRNARSRRGADPEKGAHRVGAGHGCPSEMASIDGRYCIDRWEASLVEVLPNGTERPWSPFRGTEGHVVRAVSAPGVYPQGYIDEERAHDACARSGKRLCSRDEWTQACRGPKSSTYGYGDKLEPRRCNDHGRSPVVALFGPGWMQPGRTSRERMANWQHMNSPALNQLAGTLARTGEHEGCTNEYGVYDMVGNLHEWVDDPNGTFNGGFYQDTHQHGDGCSYVTTAHIASYHDYSTGFRCCADATSGASTANAR